VTTRYLLATSDPAFENRVRQVLGAQNGDVRRLGEELLALNPVQAVAAVGSDPATAPDVVTLGPGLDAAVALDLARRFDERHPEINVVLIAQPTSALLRSALQAGVRDVVADDAPDDELRQALHRAQVTAARRRANLTGAADPGSVSRLITVVSPKGGSGKTSVAVNLAAALATTAPGEVVLVDLDLSFGDVATALRLMPEHSMADAVHNLKTPEVIGDALGDAMGDAIGVKATLTPHQSQLYALCAPEAPEIGERITPVETKAILRLLSSAFRYVICDTSAGLDDHTLGAVELATDLIAVCTMDVPSVRSCRKLLVTLDHVGMTDARRLLVLNRADARVGLEAGDIESTVGMPVEVAVPSSRLMPLAMNRGEPIVLSDPKAPVARQLRSLADRFVRQPATVEPSGRRARRWSTT
jgi:pilus assembly protein CpaE